LYDSIDIKVNELKASISKYDVIDYAVRTDEAKGANGQHILDVLNNLRENGEAYRNVGRMLFGDIENSQYQTGKPITVVATHGTNSDKLLKTMEFDSKYLGESGRHGDANDSIGAFLAGSEETSRFYSEPSNLDGKPDNKLRQVRALVKMENPLVVDVNYRSFDKNLYKNIFDKAKAGGHDGVVIQNVYDGGNPDTVYVAMSDKLKSNTAIIDTVESTNPKFFEANRPSTPRGTEKLSDLVKGSFKVREIVRETGFDKFINDARLSGRLIEGRSSTDFAGRPVVIINYDNSGVWRLTDSVTGETIGEINGGAMHNIISGKINKDKQPAVLASVNESGLNKIEEVRQLVLNGIKTGKLPKDTPLTFVINSGTLEKSLSHPQVAVATTGHLARFLQQGIISAEDLNNVVINMSEAFVIKKVGGVETKIATGVKLKHLIDKTPREQISFIQNQFLKQDKSTFDERSSTMDRLVMSFGKLKSVKGNADYFKKFFGNEDFNPSGKGFKNEFLKITDDPMSRNAQGESIGYGKIVAVLEVPSNVPIVGVGGGHTGFPVDYRSDKGKGKYNSAVMSVLDQPIKIEDMLNRPSNKDIGTHYKTDSGLTRSTSEHIMTTTATFGSGVVKEGSHTNRTPTPESEMLTGSDIKANYKPSEQQMKSEFIGKQAENNPSKISGLNLGFSQNTKDIKGVNMVTLTIDKPQSKGQAGEQIGIIMAKIYDDGTAKIDDVRVNYPNENKGYGKILYSELAERLRHLGVKEIIGDIINTEGIPQKIREKVIGNSRTDYDSPSNISESGYKTVSTLDANTRYKVSEEVKRGVSAIDSTIAKINKVSVVSSVITNALDDFKEALRKQDATDEIVVKEVEETHSALLDVLNNEIKSSSNASKPDLLAIKKKVESLDRRLENNSNRINTKIEKQKQKRHESLQRDLDEGADLDAEEMLAEEQRKEDARINYERDMEEGADIESEQLIEESNAIEDAKLAEQNKPEQVQPLEQPINQRDVWRRYVSEKTPNGSITKNSAGFSIILNGTKFRVYNPQNVLLGIYTDLEQAKRRVQREEPKQL
jgi:hypothetical protein